MTLLVLYILIAIAVSFLCSVLEAVLLSVTPTFVATIEDSRPKVAKRLQILKDDVDRPLAAILSLNTIAHTVGAAGAGAQAAFVFGEASVAVFSAILTFLILVFSEIIPKTLGAMYWQSIAPFAARILPLLIWTMWPLVKMSQAITRVLTRGQGKYTVTREEIAALADIGHREGIIDKGDSQIVANLLRFNSLEVRDIMTPRTVMFALDEAQTVGEAVALQEELRFSRIPIFSDSIDNVTGFVLKTDVLLAALAGKSDQALSALKRPLATVPENLLLEELFDALLRHDRHIALVTDAFGGTAGVVTIEDAIETLLGEEIMDEADAVEDMRMHARDRWKKRRNKRRADAPAAPGKPGAPGSPPATR